MSMRKHIHVIYASSATVVLLGIIAAITLNNILGPPEVDRKPYILKQDGVTVVCTWSQVSEKNYHEEWVCDEV